MAKLIYRADTEILGMWIMGLRAADLIQEASNAVNQHQGDDSSSPSTRTPPSRRLWTRSSSRSGPRWRTERGESARSKLFS